MAQLQKYAFRFGRALHVASLAQRPPHAHIYIYIYTHTGSSSYRPLWPGRESVKSDSHSSSSPTLFSSSPIVITIAALSCVITGAIIFPFFRRLDSKEDDTRTPPPLWIIAGYQSSNLERKGRRYTAVHIHTRVTCLRLSLSRKCKLKR